MNTARTAAVSRTGAGKRSRDHHLRLTKKSFGVGCIVAGAASALMGLAVSVLGLLLPPNRIVGATVTVTLIAAFPFLMIGAHFLDLNDREKRSASSKDTETNEP